MALYENDVIPYRLERKPEENTNIFKALGIFLIQFR